MSLQGQVALLTGASMGIGEACAFALAEQGANLVLVSRSADKLSALQKKLQDAHPKSKIIYKAADVGDYQAVDAAVASAVEQLGKIDILINNAGLALNAPSPFHALPVSAIDTMNATNVSGYMYAAHAVLNRAMLSPSASGRGTILNITSTTAHEAPPFPGEAVYHANKACQEGFTNSLRNELSGTDVRVLALRPGVVAGHFHRQRVGGDEGAYEGFMEGFEPLVAEEVAKSAVWVLSQPEKISIKALDVVPSAQRSLNVFDRKWNERHQDA
ncbi:hypothetical protein WHR41_03269 [Cladosporium halotolerans]|uniref:NADP-dependent L-serine/L-allo-threonine dehydrogenase ydfG n=1 Tax=Cladosporium halotolerans TaxID=1052096 RepID=A0AB34KVR6_9PEZI